LPLQSQIESGFRAPAWIAAFLIIGSLIFVLAERFTLARRPLESLGFIDALVMGVAQAIALLPGSAVRGSRSRPGCTRGSAAPTRRASASFSRRR
jgi:undecaprenyl-diphosphatase